LAAFDAAIALVKAAQQPLVLGGVFAVVLGDAALEFAYLD
jgi:hypothetical protein